MDVDAKSASILTTDTDTDIPDLPAGAARFIRGDMDTMTEDVRVFMSAAAEQVRRDVQEHATRRQETDRLRQLRGSSMRRCLNATCAAWRGLADERAHDEGVDMTGRRTGVKKAAKKRSDDSQRGFAAEGRANHAGKTRDHAGKIRPNDGGYESDGEFAMKDDAGTDKGTRRHQRMYCEACLRKFETLNCSDEDSGYGDFSWLDRAHKRREIWRSQMTRSEGVLVDVDTLANELFMDVPEYAKVVRWGVCA
jgi:hypothetical protein